MTARQLLSRGRRDLRSWLSSLWGHVLGLSTRGEGGKADWVAGGARREKEAAGTSRELDCDFNATCHTVGPHTRCLPMQAPVCLDSVGLGAVPMGDGNREAFCSFRQIWLIVGDRDPLAWLPELNVEF